MSLSGTPSVGEASQSKKAYWDDELTKVFIDKMVEARKQLGTHSKCERWKMISDMFKEKTGKTYTQEQLRNKRDNLRREWLIWKKLLIDATGKGWDTIRDTIQAEDEWWDKQIKKNRLYEKFRPQGLKNHDSLKILFDERVTTGLPMAHPAPGSSSLHTNEVLDTGDASGDCNHGTGNGDTENNTDQAGDDQIAVVQPSSNTDRKRPRECIRDACSEYKQDSEFGESVVMQLARIIESQCNQIKFWRGKYEESNDRCEKLEMEKKSLEEELHKELDFDIDDFPPLP